MHLEGDVRDARAGQAGNVDADPLLGQVDVLDVAERGELATDDHLDKRRLARLAGGDGADERAIAKDGHAVGDLHHLVEVVRDEEDRCAGLRRIAHEREEALDSLLRQKHRRFVENEQSVPAADAADLLDRAHDREQRPLDRLQVGDERRRVDLHAVLGERLPRALPLTSPGDAPTRPRRCDLGHA